MALIVIAAKNVRLIPPARLHHTANTPFDVGQTWETRMSAPTSRQARSCVSPLPAGGRAKACTNRAATCNSPAGICNASRSHCPDRSNPSRVRSSRPITFLSVVRSVILVHQFCCPRVQLRQQLPRAAFRLATKAQPDVQIRIMIAHRKPCSGQSSRHSLLRIAPASKSSSNVAAQYSFRNNHSLPGAFMRSRSRAS